MSILRKSVLVQLKAVLVQVKMEDMLSGKYLELENCVQSGILESELTVVIKEKLRTCLFGLESIDFGCFHCLLLVTYVQAHTDLMQC